MSALYTRANAIIPVTGVDLSAAEGKLVKFTAGVPAVHDSATVPAVGVVLEANVAAQDSSIGILGALSGTVRLKTSEALTKGQRVQQKNDGTVEADDGPGTARVVVGIACEDAAVNQLVEVATFAPMILP